MAFGPSYLIPPPSTGLTRAEDNISSCLRDLWLLKDFLTLKFLFKVITLFLNRTINFQNSFLDLDYGWGKMTLALFNIL